MRHAVFFDRDGVVNVFPGPGQFVLSWEMFQFMPGVAEQLIRLRKQDFFIALITNQSGVGRGLMPLEACTTSMRACRGTWGNRRSMRSTSARIIPTTPVDAGNPRRG